MKDALKDQLLALLSLQTVDGKVKELEAAIRALPQKLEPMRRDLARLEAMVAAERGRVGETETWKKSQEELLAREREQLKLAQSKLSGTRTGKEFHAATREVDFKRKAISERESELKKVTEALSSTSTSAGAHDKDVEDLRAHLATEQAAVDAKVKELEAEIATVATGRAELRARVEPGWLKTYDSLTSKRGYAVSPVIKGSCQGCHMKLPPQLNNILARLETLEVCPRCGRIIYREDTLAPAPDSAPEDPPSA
ncbi:MAG TPA: C4-type zinc ribbon domain-containing protein [Kofleriaceae bacterium]|nr:C4-type zinc ribbon domain-containing protein [Kofleriaceae bacterium]